MLLVTDRRPVVPLPLAHEGAVEAREVADRFLVGEVAQALGERREARLAADEAARTIEDMAPTARRVLGGAHPLTMDIETCLRSARAAFRGLETPSTGSA